jgi:hypothetical protein
MSTSPTLTDLGADRDVLGGEPRFKTRAIDLTYLSDVYRPHPFARLFPVLEGEARKALVENIRENGVVEPIVMLDGMVLDGCNRVDAARECGIRFQDIPKRQYDGDYPLAFVVSINLHRRHLDVSQRAMVAAKIADLSVGRPKKNPAIAGVSQAAAASALDASPAAVERAARVQAHGTPELISAVSNRRIPLSNAVELAGLPKEMQTEILAEGPEAVSAVVKNIRRAGRQLPSATAAERRVGRMAAAVASLRTHQTGGQPRSARRPRPLPIVDDLRFLADDCQRIIKAIDEDGPDALIDGPSDGGNRSDQIEVCRTCLSALTRLLAAWDARGAHRGLGA